MVLEFRGRSLPLAFIWRVRCVKPLQKADAEGYGPAQVQQEEQRQIWLPLRKLLNGEYTEMGMTAGADGYLVKDCERQ